MRMHCSTAGLLPAAVEPAAATVVAPAAVLPPAAVVPPAAVLAAGGGEASEALDGREPVIVEAELGSKHCEASPPDAKQNLDIGSSA